MNGAEKKAVYAVQQTLYIPLWGRKISAEKYPKLFPDMDAARIVKELGLNIPCKRIYLFQYGYLNYLIRQYDMACEINRYIKKYPNAAIVELGAGLSCLRRQMKSEKNPWYCLDMESVVMLRKKHIPKGKNEKNIACDLNDFSWFDMIDHEPNDGIIFIAGGLFCYLENRRVQSMLREMAERFGGGVIAFDALNKIGMKAVNYELERSGIKAKARFSLENPKRELESISEKIVNVSEKPYMDGYLKGGYRKTLLTKLICACFKHFHISFIVHAEFKSK